ncbi:unnamed protein product [Rhodiola kirilowii]
MEIGGSRSRRLLFPEPGDGDNENENIHKIQNYFTIESIIYQKSTLLSRMWKSTNVE